MSANSAYHATDAAWLMEIGLSMRDEAEATPGSTPVRKFTGTTAEVTARWIDGHGLVISTAAGGLHVPADVFDEIPLIVTEDPS